MQRAEHVPAGGNNHLAGEREILTFVREAERETGEASEVHCEIRQKATDVFREIKVTSAVNIKRQKHSLGHRLLAFQFIVAREFSDVNLARVISIECLELSAEQH